MASLQDLFVSKVRVKLLQIFLSEPKEIFYVRQLVRKAGEEINAVRRELARMETRGMVTREPRANRVYYGFKKSYAFYDELLATIGAGRFMEGDHFIAWATSDDSPALSIIKPSYW